jgi:uncharacterized protein
VTAIEKVPPWRQAGLRYYTYRHYLQQRFACRVQKVSIDAGFTCPNVDGTVAIGGCTFCDNRSFSPSRRLSRVDATNPGQPTRISVTEQIDQGIFRLRRRYKKCRHYLAYFQPATNTYAPVTRLRTLYREAIGHPQVVGLVIGTRPDCVPQDVLELLAEMARKTYVSVEYGMQTMHDRSLDWMNRGAHHDAMLDAMERSRGLGFEMSAHAILGLPNESLEDMVDTAREIVRLGLNAVKIHNLYCVKNTVLADQLAAGKVRLLERDEFIQAAVIFLEVLPPTMVVERISGEAPPEFFIGPHWCLDKRATIRALDMELMRRDTWQGRLWEP